MTDERLKQLADWYNDPARRLPRKVLDDVRGLILELAEARANGRVMMDHEPYHEVWCMNKGRCTTCDIVREILGEDVADPAWHAAQVKAKGIER
jgi:hypothetical protein